jgi:hypothetical protein
MTQKPLLAQIALLVRIALLSLSFDFIPFVVQSCVLTLAHLLETGMAVPNYPHFSPYASLAVVLQIVTPITMLIVVLAHDAETLSHHVRQLKRAFSRGARR